MLILFSLMVFTCIRSEDPVQGVASSATAPRPRRQQLPAARFYGPHSMRRRRLSSEQRLSDQGTSSVSELIRPVWASRRVHKINERSVWKGFHEPTRNPGKIRPSYGISSASGLVDSAMTAGSPDCTRPCWCLRGLELPESTSLHMISSLTI
jgi:hypothetical protein